jgi:hypothetical protein
MKSPSKRKPAVQLPPRTYELKIELAEVSPPVWRRLRVPGDANLGWLHAAIQMAMGWTNSHLHQFILCDRIFSDPRFEMNEFEEDPPVWNEHKTALQTLLPHMRSVFLYDYDFGDCWEHIVQVEGIADRKRPGADAAKCVDGAGVCPPEDCGGSHGYADMLEVLKDPDHDEYESTVEWLGEGFDPHAPLDLKRINRYLKKVPWPLVSIEDLGAVLMKRDGYRG